MVSRSALATVPALAAALAAALTARRGAQHTPPSLEKAVPLAMPSAPDAQQPSTSHLGRSPREADFAPR
ncbi:MAG TPA: hypothetical protein V6C88_04340, partial [Chroococcidiopsis sp.]